MKLLKDIEPYRNDHVLLDGDWVPKSAAMLISLLETVTDPDDRYAIFMHILAECHLAKKAAAAVKYAWARYEEFQDVTSMMAVSRALVDNGEVAKGLGRAREALDMAIRDQALVNYAAGNLVRVAISTGSVERINEAVDFLIDSTQVPRKGDCALETDWTDEAEALGADRELISWVRSAASKSKRR